MPSIFRGAQAQVNRSDLSGRRVWKGAAAAAVNWWDPNNVGLSIAGAYRAINSIGTPWPGGPVAYLQTLVNQANPGVDDLVEGAGGIPWVQATGWGFVAGFAQWLDTGLVPANDQSWSMFVQFANAIGAGIPFLAGATSGANASLFVSPFFGANQVGYGNGAGTTRVPQLLTGNLGSVGDFGYRDGVAEPPAIGVWANPSIQSIYIGCRNNIGVANLFVTADIESVAIYNGGAAAVQAEAAAIVAAMAAL